MLLKKSTVAFCSSGSLSTLSLPAHASITSSSNCPATKAFPSPSTSPTTSLRQRNKRQILLTTWRGSRCYATAQTRGQDESSKPYPERKSGAGIPAWPTTANPTPYDIFATTKSAPYSKKTFYQLVKLYHPDRHPHTSSSTLSQATKLDRYRLVVAANTILSDPTKRRAYDLYGAGWAGTHNMSNKAFRDADRAWRREAGSAAGNATWEDWEDWHRAHNGTSGEKQSPLYMSNGLFVVALALFVVVGSWGQATRAGNHSVHLIEMRETSSQHISEEMWKRRKEKAVLGREERIEMFLRQREGWSHGPSEDHPPKD